MDRDHPSTATMPLSTVTYQFTYDHCQLELSSEEYTNFRRLIPINSFFVSVERLCFENGLWNQQEISVSFDGWEH